MASLNQAVVEAGAGWSKSFGSNVGAFDTLAAVVTGYNTSNVVISSSAPTFNSSAVPQAFKACEARYPYDGTVTVYGAIWVFPPPAGGWAASAGPVALTVTNSSAIANVGIIALDIILGGLVPGVDQGPVTADGLSTGPSSGATGTTRYPEEIALAFIVQDQSATVLPSGWTNTGTGGDTNSLAGYQFPAAAGAGPFTYADTTSPAARWAAGVITLYAVTGTIQPPATVPLPRRGPVRAYLRSGAGQAPSAPSGVPGSVPVLMTSRTELISRVTGRVIRR